MIPLMVALDWFMGLPMVWLAVALLLLLVRRTVLRWAQQRAAATASRPDERAVRLLTRLYVPAGLLAGGYFSLQVVPLTARWRDYGERALGALALALATWVAWRGFSLLLNYWAETNPNAVTLVPPAQFAGRLLFMVIGLALVFSGLGFDITKVWTALGIGSVAIALALQDTLTNTFAGFYIMVDQPFRVGDYIRVDTGEEGRVAQIGWRSTRLHTLPNNIVVVPNSKLARASVTNYSMPQPRLSFAIPIPVTYHADPRRVCAVLEEVAGQAMKDLPGLVPDTPPAVRFTGFGDNALNFSLTCQVHDFFAQNAVQDELRYRIFERLKREGFAMWAGPAAPAADDQKSSQN